MSSRKSSRLARGMTIVLVDDPDFTDSDLDLDLVGFFEEPGGPSVLKRNPPLPPPPLLGPFTPLPVISLNFFSIFVDLPLSKIIVAATSSRCSSGTRSPFLGCMSCNIVMILLLIL